MTIQMMGKRTKCCVISMIKLQMDVSSEDADVNASLVHFYGFNDNR